MTVLNIGDKVMVSFGYTKDNITKEMHRQGPEVSATIIEAEKCNDRYKSWYKVSSSNPLLHNQWISINRINIKQFLRAERLKLIGI